MTMKNKLFGLILCLMSGLPCFADGGIPMWGVTTSHFLILSGIATPGFFMYPEFSNFVLMLVLWLFMVFIFFVVVLIETLIIHKVITYHNFKKLLKIVFKANLISTVVGIPFIFLPTPFVYKKMDGMEFGLFGPWAFNGMYSLFLSNILMLFVSYAVEYLSVRKCFEESYDKKDIKKGFMIANLATYALPLLLYGFLCFLQFKNQNG